MEIIVKNFDNEEKGLITLNPDIFERPLRLDILTRMVNWQLAKRRAGTHKTKGISDVSGTTRKPYRQKGTGRARQGSLRSPQMRGGAVIFGPVVRKHDFSLPKKVRRLALKLALSGKAFEGSLMVVENLELPIKKTKEFALKLKKMDLTSVLIIGGSEIQDNILRICRNIPLVDVLPQQGINVYDILNHKNLILTPETLNYLERRLI